MLERAAALPSDDVENRVVLVGQPAKHPPLRLDHLADLLGELGSLLRGEQPWRVEDDADRLAERPCLVGVEDAEDGRGIGQLIVIACDVGVTTPCGAQARRHLPALRHLECQAGRDSRRLPRDEEEEVRPQKKGAPRGQLGSIDGEIVGIVIVLDRQRGPSGSVDLPGLFVERTQRQALPGDVRLQPHDVRSIGPNGVPPGSPGRQRDLQRGPLKLCRLDRDVKEVVLRVGDPQAVIEPWSGQRKA